ncbi:hypothetical protein JCM11251_003810 [Rhodosporidiobolus azoricus]
MNDELDPLFLDLDVSSHSNGLGDSLGAGFGNQLDEFDNDHRSSFDSGTSPQLDLVSGFGNALGAELNGLNELAEEEGKKLRHSSTHGSVGGLSDRGSADDGHATPRRRNGSGSNRGGSRISLADELASASGPPGGRTRDLMRELGIEEGEEDELEDDGEEGESEEEEDPEEQLERRLFGGSRVEEEKSEDQFLGASASPARRPGSRLRTTQSIPSFAVEGDADETEEEPALGISQEELDAVFQEAAEALESSIATTGTFLSHLRQHVTGEVDPSSSSSAPPPPSLQHSSSTTHLTGALQRPTPSASASPDPPIDYTDHQPLVESLASSLLKRLYDVASQREAQARELTEIERVFARSEGGWQAVLAGLEPLRLEDETEEEDAERREEADDAEHLSRSNGALPIDTAYPDSPLGSPSSAHPPSTSAPPLPPLPNLTLSPADALLPPLTSLRTLTTTLLSALSTISDTSSVQSALSSEVGRKLRAVKGLVGSLREEGELREKAEEFVRVYERERERDSREKGARGRESCAEQARREVEAAKALLEDGWRKAQSMLRPSPLGAAAVEVGVAM